MNNKDLHGKGVPLNLNEDQTIHTNPDGREVPVKKIGDEYFSKRKKDHKNNTRGSSGFFPNHLEYNGWLAMNGFVEVDLEELEDKWS